MKHQKLTRRFAYWQDKHSAQKTFALHTNLMKRTWFWIPDKIQHIQLILLSTSFGLKYIPNESRWEIGIWFWYLFLEIVVLVYFLIELKFTDFFRFLSVSPGRIAYLHIRLNDQSCSSHCYEHFGTKIYTTFIK